MVCYVNVLSASVDPQASRIWAHQKRDATTHNLSVSFLIRGRLYKELKADIYCHRISATFRFIAIGSTPHWRFHPVRGTETEITTLHNALLL